MAIKFASSTPVFTPKPVAPVYPAANVAVGTVFQTNYGTIYLRTPSHFVKLGNSTKLSANQPSVKDLSYFAKDTRSIKIFPDAKVELGNFSS